MSEGGRLAVCATPIGNLSDISDRLRSALSEADLIYAEDTRRTGILLSHIGSSTPVRSLFAGNEKARTDELVGNVVEGKSVALVSDAGMPTVSDPGAEAVRRVRAAGKTVEVIPGPSAVTTAVALSGFSGDRFVFDGFLPRKGKERSVSLQRLVGEDRMVVLFVSPNRLVGDLEDLVAHIGPDRQIAITRELTKLHEEVWVGTVADAVEEWSGRTPKGEFTVVLGPGERDIVSLDDAIAEARDLVDSGIAPSVAARQVAGATGLSRRRIYEDLIARQD